LSCSARKNEQISVDSSTRLLQFVYTCSRHHLSLIADHVTYALKTLRQHLIFLLTSQCIRSTLLHDKIVSLLLSMLGPQLELEGRTMKSKLGVTIMRPGVSVFDANTSENYGIDRQVKLPRSWAQVRDLDNMYE